MGMVLAYILLSVVVPYLISRFIAKHEAEKAHRAFEERIDRANRTFGEKLDRANKAFEKRLMENACATTEKGECTKK